MKQVAFLVALLFTSAVASSAQEATHLGDWSVIDQLGIGNPHVVTDGRVIVVAGGDRGGDLLISPPLPRPPDMVQLAVPTPTGLQWLSSVPVPYATPSVEYSLFLHGNGVYLLSAGSVHRASIDAAGQMSGWQHVGSVPVTARRPVVLHNHLFLFDGIGSAVASVPLLEGGGVGPLRILGALPGSGWISTVFATRTHIYVFHFSSAAGRHEVLVAEAYPDGTLGPWRLTNAPPRTPSRGIRGVGASAGNLYVVQTVVDGAGESHITARARILLDGSLVEWEPQTPLVRRMTFPSEEGGNYYFQSIAVAGRYVYSFGGTLVTGGYMQYVDGTIVRSVIGSPVVRVQSPDPVPTSGTSLIAEGFNFVPGTRAFVNDAEVPVQAITPTSLTIAVPPGPEGPARLRVVNPDGASTTVPFRYAAGSGGASGAPLSFTAAVEPTGAGNSLVTLQWQPPSGGPPLSWKRDTHQERRTWRSAPDLRSRWLP